jgi:hypothetical protein
MWIKGSLSFDHPAECDQQRNHDGQCADGLSNLIFSSRWA